MKEQQYIIRAHHGMCLAFFIGKGYSREFTEHMQNMKDILKTNPSVKIVSKADDICSACPNNQRGICTSAEKVAEYDKSVLLHCGMSDGDVISFQHFEELVYNHILLSGKREEICGDCRWNSLCHLSTTNE